ncbi:MBL fold metallo-hydrolase [Halomicroarcula sp. F13]|uniref:MBL fold metallo-hydrolase n=1 Tax=Haloarcula rubra TaxID=2487747 RepID=A0AAW4PP57_9EURY|nr:MBL fold metallo-hydrolase [Halomicroarcula rubra]MBX0322773.1 MBL fold metallo-hydrolase [Halomicroarcula rubra]
MEVQFLGGADEIGRSAVLVDDSLLLDYGMASESPPQYPVGDVDPDAVVVSHGHLDHAGAVPALMSSGDLPPVHWTPPTRDLATTLAEDTLKLHGSTPRCPFTDTDVRRLTQASVTHGYGESFEAAGYDVTLYNAGHIPGSAHVLVDDSEVRRTSGNRTQSDDGETQLLYTGDFHTGTQRLVAPSTARPEVDAVICESTYSDVTHEARETVEKRFVESVRQTVWEGGTVVVPAFAIGRTQEVMLVCAAHDVDCYVDGMGQRVTEQLKRHPEFLRDADALSGATSAARFVDGRDGQRKRIAKQNTVIVTTSGMLSGGPAMTYVPAIRQHPTNKVALTGYQVEGTPGRELLETGSAELDGRVLPVSAQVELHQFSAHADREGLLDFLDSYRDTAVLVNHGDRTAAFAEALRADGFTASAPELGETVEL